MRVREEDDDDGESGVQGRADQLLKAKQEAVAATPPSAGMSAAADVLLPASSTPAAPGSTLANDAAVSTAVPAPLQGSAGGGGASGDGANVPRAPPSWYNAMLCRFVKALC